MAQAIPQQHPAVVLRSHYVQLRALLAVAMIAVAGLTAGVVILATDDASQTPRVSIAPPAVSPPADGTRFDGGPEEGTRGAVGSRATPGTRYDGGPEEGTRGAVTSSHAQAVDKTPSSGLPPGHPGQRAGILP